MNMGLIVWILFAIALVGVVGLLADGPSRKVVVVWAGAGILIDVAKSNLMQLAPQWKDTPLDAVTYALQAAAFRLHWSGEAVDAASYQLRGYQAGWSALYGPSWLVDAPVSYAGVLGSSEWGYPAFLALWSFIGDGWQSWAILSNAAMCGALVGCAYILALQLGARPSVAHLAALLVAVDPLLSVNGLWLLKDSLASLLSVVALILACRLVRRPSLDLRLMVGLVLVLCTLGSVRFVAYFAFSLALTLVGAGQLLRRENKNATFIVLTLAASVVCLGLVYFAPNLPTPSQIGNAVLSPLKAQATTLQADRATPGFDPTVAKWRQEITTDAASSGVRAVARTLLAPYPWIAFTHGLSGDNHMELYLPGMALWIVCLPALIVGIWVAARRANAGTWIFLLFLTAIAAAYVIFFGEWSTRQRVFLNPLLYVFAAMGWYALGARASPYFRRLPGLSG